MARTVSALTPPDAPAPDPDAVVEPDAPVDETSPEPTPTHTRVRVGEIEYSLEDARRLGIVGTPVQGP